MVFKKYSLLMSLALLASACGTAATTVTGGGTGSGSLTLTGTATYSTGSSTSVSSPLLGTISLAESTAGDGDDVTLVQIGTDGTRTTEATTTTDENGQFTIAGAEEADTGTAEGAFYYEICVTDDTNTVCAPVAPEADMDVTVDTSSSLAADILSDAITASGDKAIIDPLFINNMSALVETDLTDNYDGNITIPPTSDTAEMTALAEGITTGDGISGDLLTAAQLSNDYLTTIADETSVSADYAGVIQRMNSEICGTSTSSVLNGEMVNGSAIEVLGDAIVGDTTFTISQLVSLYNTGLSGTLDADEVVSDFAAGIVAAEAVLTAEGDTSTADTPYYLIAKGIGFDASTLSTTTELNSIQAYLIFMNFPTTRCSFGAGGVSSLATLIHSLIAGSMDTTPTIESTSIYASSTGACSAPALGTFNAIIQVNKATLGRSISQVVITSDDPTALGGDGTVTIASSACNEATCTHPVGTECVSLDHEATYTITATFSDAATPATATVTRNHPEISETDVSYDGVELSDGTPVPIVDTLPLFTWTTPEDKLIAVAAANPDTGVPTGSAIKYSYEFSFCNKSSSGASSGCSSPLTGSGCVTTSPGTLYAVDNFIPTTECNPAACAASNSLASSDVTCRVNLQTYLVDEFDSKLGQAAGNFRRYCLDADNNDACD